VNIVLSTPCELNGRANALRDLDCFANELSRYASTETATQPSLVHRNLVRIHPEH
jgi:hypothetical protein